MGRGISAVQGAGASSYLSGGHVMTKVMRGLRSQLTYCKYSQWLQGAKSPDEDERIPPVHVGLQRRDGDIERNNRKITVAEDINRCKGRRSQALLQAEVGRDIGVGNARRQQNRGTAIPQ